MEWRSVPDGLSLRLAVRAAEAMPVWIGIHPWFRRVLDDGRVLDYSFDAKQMYLRGSDGIPTGELVPVPPGPWDDCFSGVSEARLNWGDLGVVVTASSDIWVVFDERPEAVCVEPQTGPPDAVRLGEANWLASGRGALPRGAVPAGRRSRGLELISVRSLGWAVGRCLKDAATGSVIEDFLSFAPVPAPTPIPSKNRCAD